MTPQGVFLGIFVVLQVLDIWTTLKALKMGHREMNPILAKLFEKYDPLATMVAFKVAAIFSLWWADLVIVSALCCVVYFYVIANNLRVIRG
jgi:hypothetical protein